MLGMHVTADIGATCAPWLPVVAAVGTAALWLVLDVSDDIRGR